MVQLRSCIRQQRNPEKLKRHLHVFRRLVVIAVYQFDYSALKLFTYLFICLVNICGTEAFSFISQFEQASRDTPQYHNAEISKAGKVFHIPQCRVLETKYDHSKLNDFIHCVEAYGKREHYENILRDTVADIERADEFDPPHRKRVRGSQVNYKTTYFEVVENILMFLPERFSGIQEYAFF
ncbi:Hypothetical predicted protein [Octopus vulgaris]|uniref:Uncharacterized protein n=1 Tax=Octopus vulgaris TaxID=6645 RepID=A0AA36AU38_OCTVU|nr:Hypothetical predicted protein [Octopus vulgaris]